MKFKTTVSLQVPRFHNNVANEEWNLPLVAAPGGARGGGKCPPKVFEKIRNVRGKISEKKYGKNPGGQKFWQRGGGGDFVKFYLAPKMRVAPRMPPQIPRPGAATACHWAQESCLDVMRYYRIGTWLQYFTGNILEL